MIMPSVGQYKYPCNERSEQPGNHSEQRRADRDVLREIGCVIEIFFIATYSHVSKRSVSAVGFEPSLTQW